MSPWRRVRRVRRYRLRKFARKYKKALATAAAFAVLLVAGVVMSTLLAVWATSAERYEAKPATNRLGCGEARGLGSQGRGRQTAR